MLIESITPHHIHNYLDTLKSNNLYNVHRKELSALFNYVKRKMKVDIHNPCADLEKMPHSPAEKKIPSEEDVIKLLLAAKKGDEQDILLCCLHTLGRIDEILRIKWEDVNLQNRIVILWTRKRKDGAYEPDPMPINEDLYEVLSRRWKKRNQDMWVFFNDATGTRFMHRPRMMKGLCKRAGINHYGFHSLRHFMASYLADRQKVGTQAVSKLLRHKNLRTTEIYLHSLDEMQRSAMESIEGKFTSNLEKALTTPSHKKEKEATGKP